MFEEFALNAYRRIFSNDDLSVVAGCGRDDCAHVRIGPDRLAITVDGFAEGTHFLPDVKPEDLARKVAGATLSDIAASACTPLWGVVSLCVRTGLPDDWPWRFSSEMSRACKEFGCTIIGGDTMASPTGIFVSMTAIGKPLPGGPIYRTGGKWGDVLVVTGALGGTLLGKHLRPIPRLREIALLMNFCNEKLGGGEGNLPTALMDISDGVALEVWRIGRDSRVGSMLYEDLIPIANAAKVMAEQTGEEPIYHALSDGEDFELLIAMPPDVWEAFQQYLRTPEGKAASEGLAAFTEIGRLTNVFHHRMTERNGTQKFFPPIGYEHEW